MLTGTACTTSVFVARRSNGGRLRLAGAVALAVSVLGRGEAAAAGQEEQFTPEFREVHRGHDPKHTPTIEAPDSVKRGEWFDVTVSVAHPSLSEHFVRSIALYINTAEIARVYLHPVFSAPTVRFRIALDEGGSLRVLSEPTHSAAWEASKKIAVVP